MTKNPRALHSPVHAPGQGGGDLYPDLGQDYLHPPGELIVLNSFLTYCRCLMGRMSLQILPDQLLLLAGSILSSVLRKSGWQLKCIGRRFWLWYWQRYRCRASRWNGLQRHWNFGEDTTSCTCCTSCNHRKGKTGRPPGLLSSIVRCSGRQRIQEAVESKDPGAEEKKGGKPDFLWNCILFYFNHRRFAFNEMIWSKVLMYSIQ